MYLDQVEFESESPKASTLTYWSWTNIRSSKSNHTYYKCLWSLNRSVLEFRKIQNMTRIKWYSSSSKSKRTHKTKDLLWLMKTMILFVSSTDNVSVLKFTRIFNLVLQKENIQVPDVCWFFHCLVKYVILGQLNLPKTFWVSFSSQSLFLNEVYILW